MGKQALELKSIFHDLTGNFGLNSAKVFYVLFLGEVKTAKQVIEGTFCKS